MNQESTAFQERPPNWLPLPGDEVVLEANVASVVDENDFFCKAEVVTYYPAQRCGVLKNDHGVAMPFRLQEVSLKGSPARLRQGIRVGYDASQTSHGMRVVTLRIY